ncbi:hypothetical protein JCM3774_001368 [Rhodotorula dairenensis]
MGDSMDPLVSERLFIDWLPPAAPAVHIDHERVIVIQGRSGFYLDVRYMHADSGADTLGWATAGWKTLQPVGQGQDPRARFTAVFDSHKLQSSSPHAQTATSGVGPEPEDPPDEGSFSTLSNGDVLEQGEMRRPETGEVTPYRELWRRLPLILHGDQSAPVRVVLLETIDAGTDKAFLGRVGDFEVCIAQQGARVDTRIRRYSGSAWVTTSSTYAGDETALPSLDGVEQLAVQNEFGLAGRRWKVIENSV